MFEPIHGSAFDIMGQGLANPIGTFWACAMMLEHLGEAEAAARLMGAIEQVTAEPRPAHARPRRQGDDGDVTRAVCAALAAGRGRRAA